MQQVVYVDILIFMNTIVTFMLLLTVRQFTGIEAGAVRLLLASAVGGVYSLVLLAPEMSFWLAVFVKLLMGITIVMIAFRTRVARKMLRCILLFSGFSFFYAGVIYALAPVLGNGILQINNGFAYYDLSYTSVILLCVALYFLLCLFKRHFPGFSQKDMLYKMKITNGEQTVAFTALLDSGNHMRDPYAGRPVILISPAVAKSLTGFDSTGAMVEEMERQEAGCRFRLLPVTALGSAKMLPALTADRAVVYADDEEKVISRPCIAATDDPLGGDRYQALINEAVFLADENKKARNRKERYGKRKSAIRGMPRQSPENETDASIENNLPLS